MLIVMVHVHIKPEFIEPFRLASLENARESVKEAGIARFDVVQQIDDNTRFVLVEVYRSSDAPAKHRETKHYQAWREAVEPMMAEPRSRVNTKMFFLMIMGGDKMRFEFSTTAQIIFGEGTLKEVGAIATLLGKHPLVICGKGAANPSALLASLMENGLDYAVFEVEGEPTIQLIENAIRLARQEKCDFVIGFGGGSAMDAAKSLACMMTNPGDLIDYLEVIGQGKKLSQPGLPVIAIPTTAGTGAEVTRNTVLASPEKKV